MYQCINVLTNVSTKSNYKIPLLALVNPPSLRIKNVDIEFSVELDQGMTSLVGGKHSW